MRHSVGGLHEAVAGLLEVVAGVPQQVVAGLLGVAAGRVQVVGGGQLGVAAGLVRDVADSLGVAVVGDFAVGDSHVCLAVDSQISCVSTLCHTQDREGAFSCS